MSRDIHDVIAAKCVDSVTIPINNYARQLSSSLYLENLFQKMLKNAENAPKTGLFLFRFDAALLFAAQSFGQLASLQISFSLTRLIFFVNII